MPSAASEMYAKNAKTPIKKRFSHIRNKLRKRMRTGEVEEDEETRSARLPKERKGLQEAAEYRLCAAVWDRNLNHDAWGNSIQLRGTTGNGQGSADYNWSIFKLPRYKDDRSKNCWSISIDANRQVLGPVRQLPQQHIAGCRSHRNIRPH